ncbi:hypothetical protein PsorP6_004301 [Peronosclerospora sorghi]|uniref:Uncharacterized protein n=1 Tax=Peronosclerospora sorghi TaxID=230839 RepID=A0ACC0VLI4_9STRA|nr:hypothetical protein PsorP6_004301 [Peronosclerospora sorghi]
MNIIPSLRIFLALLWWHFCHFLSYHLHVRGLKRANQYFHKVLIIGDDFAAGIGDYITLGGAGGGIAEYLKKIIAYNDKKNACPELIRCSLIQVRHRWEIINAGVPGSTTADWLLSSPKKVSYLNHVLTSRAMSDASIVIIILGSVEIKKFLAAADLSKMKRNLTEICDTLRKKGKQVCLAAVASPEPIATETDNISSAVNTALELYCKRCGLWEGT